MGQSTAVYVNDYDLSRLGLVVDGLTGLRDGVAFRYLSAPVPGLVGAVRLSPLPDVGPRTVQISGTLRRASTTDLVAAFDELQSRLQAGDIELRVVDKTDRFLLCRYVGRPHTPLQPQLLSKAIRLQITLEALDPLWYDWDPLRVVAPVSTRARIPIGTAPVSPLLTFSGGNNPIATIRNHAGDVTQTLGLTVTLAATDYVEVDCAAKTITKYASGTASDALSTLSSGDFLVVSPEEGNEIDASYPTIEVSAGNILVDYRRGWMS